MISEYKVFINKKEYKVSYLIYLCHMTGRFNKFETLDIYIDFYRTFRFKDRPEFNLYLLAILNDIEEFKDKRIVFKNLEHSNLKNFSNLITKHGLSFVFFLINYFSYTINKKERISYRNNLRINEILNNICNYNFLNSKQYKLLEPHLKFYKNLANCNTTNYLNVEEINLVLTNLDTDLTVDLIKEDLFNNGLVLPYKEGYIWSSDYLLKSIRVMDITLINILCLNFLLSKLKI